MGYNPTPGLRLPHPLLAFLLAGFFFILALPLIWPQEDLAASYAADPAKAIGMTLKELYAVYGIPTSVLAVRGLEEWQDDVVFSYGDRNYYVYRDRIWQLELRSAYGLKVGDSRNAIPLLLGDGKADGIAQREAYTLYSIPNLPWPVSIRFNTDPQGIIQAIFIYRADF